MGKLTTQLFILLAIVTLVRCKNLHGVAKIGILVDFNHDLNKGVNNQSIEQFTQLMKVSSSEHFTVEPVIISDYDQFVITLDDDPLYCSHLTAIVSAVSCEMTKNLYDLMEEFCPGTVILAIHERTCIRPSKYRGIGFPVRSSIVDVVPMLMDMRYDFISKWHQIHLIHDESIKEDQLDELVSGLTSSDTFVYPPELTVWSVTGSGSAVKVLDHHNCTRDDIRKDMVFTPSHLASHIREDQSMQYFIVVGKSGTIEHMIEEGHEKGLMVSPRRWLFVLTDQIKRKTYWNNLGPILALTNSAVIQRELNQYSKCNRFSEDCQFISAFSSLKEALQRASSNITDQNETILLTDRAFLRNRLVSDLKYLLTLPHHTGHCGNCDRFVLKMFQMAPKKVDTKPWLKRKQTPNSVWMPNQDFSVYVSEEGEWLPTKGYMAKNQVFPAFLDAGLQFKQKELRVAIFQQLPRIHVNKFPNGTCNVTGSTPEILRLLEERLNFTIKWDCSETTHGYKDKNGKWQGVMRLLVENKVDMGGNGFWKLPIWKDAVKWSAAFNEESVVMMVQKSTEDHKWLFLLPFTWDVWYALIGALLLIGPFIYYVNWRCKYYDYNNIRKDKGLFSLGNCYWYSFGAMVNQGGDYLPPSVTTRMIVAFWWLFVIVVSTAYSGNLVACLTFPKILQPIQNAEDVLNAWFLSWATQVNSPIAEVVKIEKYQPIAMLRRKMEYMDINVKRPYIFDEVGDDTLVWLGLDEEVKYFVSIDYLGPNWEHKDDGTCRLHKARDDVYRAPVYFPFNKNFDENTPRKQGMIHLINEQLLELGMAGFVVHWMKYYAQIGNDCLQPLLVYAGDVRKIEVLHMFGSYVILGLGIGISLVLFAGEVLYWRLIRPCLPEKWKADSSNAHDYYNKVFVGYGYSNVRPNSPAKPKPNQPAAGSIAQTMKATASPSTGLPPAAINGQIQRVQVKNTSENLPTGLYDPNLSGNYNTRTNYNYYNYGSQKATTNFATKFGINGGM